MRFESSGCKRYDHLRRVFSNSKNKYYVPICRNKHQPRVIRISLKPRKFFWNAIHEVAQSPFMYLIHPLITHSLFIFVQVAPRQLDSASSNLRIFSRSRGTSVSHRFSPFLYPRLSRFLWPAGIPMIFSTIPFGPFLSGCCWLASRPRLEAAVARLQFFHFFGHSFPCSVWPVGSASFPP